MGHFSLDLRIRARAEYRRDIENNSNTVISLSVLRTPETCPPTPALVGRRSTCPGVHFAALAPPRRRCARSTLEPHPPQLLFARRANLFEHQVDGGPRFCPTACLRGPIQTPTLRPRRDPPKTRVYCCYLSPRWSSPLQKKIVAYSCRVLSPSTIRALRSQLPALTFSDNWCRLQSAGCHAPDSGSGPHRYFRFISTELILAKGVLVVIYFLTGGLNVSFDLRGTCHWGTSRQRGPGMSLRFFSW